MQKLKHDWLTEGLIDYEYKKYILLAYLKDVKKRFNQSELYPFLSDLLSHYKNLLKVKHSKELISDYFPQKLSKADIEKLQLSYDKIIKDDEVMEEIEEILGFALPKIKSTLDEGKEIYEFVEENIEMESVGVSPLYQDEGYLFINHEASKDVSIYRYQMTFFEHADEKYRSISTEFISNQMKSLSNTFENIKVGLAKTITQLPNPATFLAISKLKFPLEETVLPVAKRMLVKHLALAS